MGDHAAANEDIWPSQNDVAQTAGNGKKLLENQWASLIARFGINNYALSGLTVPGTSGTLNIDVASGTACIAGRWISIPAATAVTAAASATNHVFLKLLRDGSNLVTGASFEVNTTGTPPADSIAIATVIAGATTITSTTDQRILPGKKQLLTSGTSWICPAGITRIRVRVRGAGGGGGGAGALGDGGGPTNGGDGSAGGTGGTTQFHASAVSANGGGGGGGGGGQISTTYFRHHGLSAGDASTATGEVTLTGRGMPGGGGGAPNGGKGGAGAYAESFLAVTPGTAYTYAIGAGGTGGGGGLHAGGGNADSGATGAAGRIEIEF